MTDRQRERKVQRQLESESRWLQQVLFALGKAREAREGLAETQDGELGALITLQDGTKVPLDALEEIIDQRVSDLRGELGQGTYGFSK